MALSVSQLHFFVFLRLPISKDGCNKCQRSFHLARKYVLRLWVGWRPPFVSAKSGLLHFWLIQPEESFPPTHTPTHPSLTPLAPNPLYLGDEYELSGGLGRRGWARGGREGGWLAGGTAWHVLGEPGQAARSYTSIRNRVRTFR